MNEKKLKIFSEMNVAKAIFVMALPVVIGMMVQVLYNLVDTFFIGQMQDANQLAAANLTTPLFMILMAISGIIGTGAASYISRCLGEKKYLIANQTLSISLGIIALLAVGVTIFGVIFCSQIVTILGAKDSTFAFAYDYTIVLLIGSVFIMANYALGQLMRSEGAAMSSMIGMLIGTIVNIVLDPIFIFTFQMGLKGAAIATVAGNAFGLIYYLYHYASKRSLVKFNVKSMKPKASILKQIFVIGTPASVNQMLLSVAMILCNNLASSYGDNFVAGIGVASKIMTIGTFVFIGFSSGCQPLVGYNYGMKNWARMKSIIKHGMVIVVILGILLMGIFWVFAPYLILIFTQIEEVVPLGVMILRALMWSLPVMGIQMISNTTVQAMGKGFASLLLSVTRQGLLYIPILFILNSLFQSNGLMYAQPISDILSMFLAVSVLIVVLEKSKKKEMMTLQK